MWSDRKSKEELALLSRRIPGEEHRAPFELAVVCRSVRQWTANVLGA